MGHTRVTQRAVLCALAMTLVLSGCTPAVAVAPGTVTVTLENNGCELAPASVEATDAGEVQFSVVNVSDEVARFAVLDAEGEERGGVGNIPVGITRDALLVLEAGSYTAECTPGPTAESVETSFTVSGGSPAAPISTAGSAEAYLDWVHTTTTAVLDATRELATAFDAGDPTAREQYVAGRTLWSSLRPATQRFPELLPSIENRESDLVAGERLTGWHALEKDLWAPAGYEPMGAAERTALSARLVADITEVAERILAPTFAMDAVEIAAGAQGLLDAASRSLIDNDERWSHAEFALVQGDLDGATAALDALRPGLTTGAPALLETVETRAASLQEALDSADPDRREVAIGIDALATGLSELHARLVRDARIEP